ncbi:TPA: hypothetical protein PRQ69_004526 [Escherichia coli]|nr:hypothetical protein [Escherichia coli]
MNRYIRDFGIRK